MSRITLLSLLLVTHQAMTFAPADTATAYRYLEMARELKSALKYDSAILYYDQSGDLFFDGKEWEMYFLTQNGIISSLIRLGNYGRAIKTSQNALARVTDDMEGVNTELATLYHNLGIIYGRTGRFDDELLNIHRAKRIWESQGDSSLQQVASAINNIGYHHSRKGELDSAISYYQQAYEIRRELFGDKHRTIALAFNNLGRLYGRKGDIQLELSYLQKAKNLWVEILGEDHHRVCLANSNLGNWYYKHGSIRRAIDYHRQAVQGAITIFGEQHHSVALYYNNLANALGKSGDPETQIEKLKKAAEIYEKVLGEMHYRTAVVYHSLAEVYLTHDQPDLASTYARKSLDIRTDAFGLRHPMVAKSYILKGMILESQDKWEEAAKSYQKALVANSHNFDAEDYGINPSAGDVLSPSENLKALVLKAGVLEKLSNNSDLKLLNHSLLCLQSAAGFLNTIRSEVIRDESKLNLAESNLNILESGVRVAHTLLQLTGNTEYFEDAFRFSELSKANLLEEVIRRTEILEFANLPDSVVPFERRLLREIAFYEKALIDEQQKSSPDTGKIYLWRSALTDLLVELDEHKIKLRDVYPDYYHFKYSEDFDSRSVEDLLLDRKTSFVAYFLGENALYIFVINRSGRQMARVALTEPLEERVLQLRKALAMGDFDTFTASAGKLYKALIGPVRNELNPTLIIIPDGILHFLPFEVLIDPDAMFDANGVYKHLPYLIRDFQIGYNLSASLAFQQLWSGQRKSYGTFIGFAPDYSGEYDTDGGFQKLSGTKKEVSDIADLLDGDKLTGPEASVDNFMLHARNYSIVHLACHAFTDDTNPKFSRLVLDPSGDGDGILHTYELYNLDLNADLVTLSACNTGIGKIARGEGILGLARGFTYAGTPSLLMSLWSVPDDQTGKIMTGFYRELKKGRAKDKALRLAKLKYLESSNNLVASPYYWGGFVISGNPSKVSLGGILIYWLVGAGVLLMVLSLWFYFRSGFQSASTRSKALSL